jgi:hypothetical protein
MTGCRNSVATLSQAFAQFLTFSVFQRVKLLARGDVFGPNRSHSHSPIRGLHGEDLNNGGHGLTTLVRFYVARCDLGVICLFSPNPALSQCGEYWPVFWSFFWPQIARSLPSDCPTIAPACRNVTAIWMGFCIDKFLVQVGQRWVPKLRTKLTRSLWYTLGTAHDFESKRPQSARSFSSQFSLHIKPSLQ